MCPLGAERQAHRLPKLSAHLLQGGQSLGPCQAKATGVPLGNKMSPALSSAEGQLPRVAPRGNQRLPGWGICTPDEVRRPPQAASGPDKRTMCGRIRNVSVGLTLKLVLSFVGLGEPFPPCTSPSSVCPKFRIPGWCGSPPSWEKQLLVLQRLHSS